MHPVFPHRSAQPRSRSGGRHELGQNFLHHRPTIDRIAELASGGGRGSGSSRRSGPGSTRSTGDRSTRDPSTHAPGTSSAILEIGPGDGALTADLVRLGRPLTLVELDEHRVRDLRRRFPRAEVVHADALRVPFDAPLIVGNLPFHLTTPLLRKLLRSPDWERAILVTQWEVARKRAGVGGGTLLTGQSAPWFEFRLRCRVPARAFRPVPGVDGGLLDISRRESPLVPTAERSAYERFVRRVFTARGRGLSRILEQGLGFSRADSAAALRGAGLDRSALPRDVGPQQWADLWRACRPQRG